MLTSPVNNSRRCEVMKYGGWFIWPEQWTWGWDAHWQYCQPIRVTKELIRICKGTHITRWWECRLFFEHMNFVRALLSWNTQEPNYNISFLRKVNTLNQNTSWSFVMSFVMSIRYAVVPTKWLNSNWFIIIYLQGTLRFFVLFDLKTRFWLNSRHFYKNS